MRSCRKQALTAPVLTAYLEQINNVLNLPCCVLEKHSQHITGWTHVHVGSPVLIKMKIAAALGWHAKSNRVTPSQQMYGENHIRSTFDSSARLFYVSGQIVSTSNTKHSTTLFLKKALIYYMCIFYSQALLQKQCKPEDWETRLICSIWSCVYVCAIVKLKGCFCWIKIESSSLFGKYRKHNRWQNTLRTALTAQTGDVPIRRLLWKTVEKTEGSNSIFAQETLKSWLNVPGFHIHQMLWA